MLCLLLLNAWGAVAQDAPPPTPAASTGAVRVFLDCSYFCDENYLRREITEIGRASCRERVCYAV